MMLKVKMANEIESSSPRDARAGSVERTVVDG